ncbi:MAG: transporter substrate-binding domain-containing protein [Arcobacteraceae bacterium]|nr:transporter substrate-binding domain-containing protein [Arcobacteraceae bacterium]
MIRFSFLSFILLLFYGICNAQEITNEDSFTTQEIDYLKSKKVIKMCNNQNWEPIEFALNDNQSQMSGIAIDVLKLLEKKLNVTFQNVPTKNWTESQQFLKEKKCDILPAAGKTAKREEYANFTKIYLDYKIAIITKTEISVLENISQLDGKIMTRKKGSSLIDMMKMSNPSVKVIETNDYLESLTMVEEEKADFTIAPVPEASYYMSKYGLYNLHIAGYLDKTMQLSIAVRKDDMQLLHILDKGLSQIESHEMKQIYDDWTNIKFKESFFETKLAKVLAIVFFVVILFFLYRHFLTNKANKNLKIAVKKKTLELEKLNKELTEYSLKLKDLNENLEQKIVIEVDKVKKIESQLFQSEKMAAMGEMMGNIAHQWRQPLSLISTSATGVLMQKEFNILDDTYLIARMNDINNATQFLSKTIDDFRDLAKGDLVFEKFNLLETINKCLLIEDPILQNHHIELIKNIDKSIEIISYQNPIIQSLMNIINNAKDILVEKDFEEKYIFLTVIKEDNGVLISVKDNGGGISEKIIEHIFEPYFTTKHKTQGTGLGLHMTYNMISNELQGNISVKNRIYEYNKKIYNGAEFMIRLPFKIAIIVKDDK